MLNIYFLKLDFNISDHDLSMLEKTISTQRVEYAKQYHQKKDYIRSLLSSVVLYYALDKNGIDKKNIVIEKSPMGKPFLKNSKDFKNIDFNITHSGDWVACAIDSGGIGIDIEQIKDIDLTDFEEILSTKETDYIDGNLENFYQIWTLKESFLKALGVGVYKPLSSFSIQPYDKHYAKVFENDYDEQQWYFYNFKLDEKHFCSICSQSKISKESFNFLEYESFYKLATLSR
ncbi:4'-phosphopantetheinyl transferase family protein [Arcobacter peruensis]|uniref:4'-phosphopantetheinyl transferase family protein n=1 Tax=Arcobacter peruensis TaxID=2320140 RepID=UPI000F078060|nr:4'-phosphopantetheinyl transferase superfamily protein [Arcobacter peruensis]